MIRNIEILAPAGSFETLQAAVCAGADAVYVGGSQFGARAYAQNFTEQELLNAIDYVHLHGRKIYLTVNTLLKEKELSKLYDYLEPYYVQGLDAVIVQDPGVLLFIKEHFPGLPIHASTQMTITHTLAARYLESIGVERVVPARELSLKEIKKITKSTGLEMECFVHGALCYCYSGQCLLSSLIGGRSGNRGQCAQPCRLPYITEDGRKPMDLMSLKDLCTIDMIPEMIESGITSFKIEGRMKQASYVSAVVQMYKKYTDLYLQNGRKGYRVSVEDRETLKQAYLRRGYCDGYYHRHNGKQMISLERPKSVKDREDAYLEQKIQEKINGNLIISPGKRVKLVLEYHGITIAVEGAKVEQAFKQPVTKERLEKQMRKTGNTPFVFERLDVLMDGPVFIPVQSLNVLRRMGIEALEKSILVNYRRQIPPNRKAEHPLVREKADYELEPSLERRLFTVSVETNGQLEAALKFPEVDRIYIEDTLFMDKATKSTCKQLVREGKKTGKQIYFSMARIFRDEAYYLYEDVITELMELFDGALIRNLESQRYLESYGYRKPVVSDTNVYQWNKKAKEFYRKLGIYMSSMPVELNYRELKELGAEGMELIVYGYLPVMVSAGCIRKNTDQCTGRLGQMQITDRFKKKFTVKNICSYCYNVIYNTDPFVLLDQKSEIESLHVSGLRLMFTVESQEQTERIISQYIEVFLEGKEARMPVDSFTRGHFKRGVK